MRLKNFTDDELRRELERRTELKRLARPQPKANPDMEPVIRLVNNYIDKLAAEGERDEDVAVYIFEAAVTAIYSDKVWPWINAIER